MPGSARVLGLAREVLRASDGAGPKVVADRVDGLGRARGMG